MKKNYYGFYKELSSVEPFVHTARCWCCGTELISFGLMVCLDCFEVHHTPKKITHLPRSHSR